VGEGRYMQRCSVRRFITEGLVLQRLQRVGTVFLFEIIFCSVMVEVEVVPNEWLNSVASYTGKKETFQELKISGGAPH